MEPNDPLDQQSDEQDAPQTEQAEQTESDPKLEQASREQKQERFGEADRGRRVKPEDHRAVQARQAQQTAARHTDATRGGEPRGIYGQDPRHEAHLTHPETRTGQPHALRGGTYGAGTRADSPERARAAHEARELRVADDDPSFPGDTYEQLQADVAAFEEDDRQWRESWENRKDHYGRLSVDDVVQHQRETTERGRAGYLRKQEFLERQHKLDALSRQYGTQADFRTYAGRDHRTSHMGIDPDDGRTHLGPLPQAQTSGGVLPPTHEQSHSNVDAVDPYTGQVLRTPGSVPYKVETAPPPAARPLSQREATLVRPHPLPAPADITRQEVEVPGEVLPADHPRSPSMVNEPMSATGRPADPRVFHGRPGGLETASERREPGDEEKEELRRNPDWSKVEEHDDQDDKDEHDEKTPPAEGGKDQE